jgi:hypothetical protein
MQKVVVITDVSGQLIVTLEDMTDRLPRNVGNDDTPRERLDERSSQLLFACSRYAFCGGKCRVSSSLCGIRGFNGQRSFLPSRDNAILICCHFIGTNSTHMAERCSHVVKFSQRHGCSDGLISVFAASRKWEAAKETEISCLRRVAMWHDVTSVAIV